MVGVYKIVSPVGKVYIGQSWDISSRWRAYHRGYGSLSQRHLNRSFKKYGVRSHRFELLHVLPCDITQIVLDTYEEVYMSFYRECFELLNIREAGSRGRLSQETKNRISEGNKGKVRSEEVKRKISEAKKGSVSPRKGVRLPPEQVERIRLARLGTKMSPESSEKKRKATKGVKKGPFSPEHIQKLKDASRRRYERQRKTLLQA